MLSSTLKKIENIKSNLQTQFSFWDSFSQLPETLRPSSINSNLKNEHIDINIARLGARIAAPNTFLSPPSYFSSPGSIFRDLSLTLKKFRGHYV
jgi:hypothetical protein